MKSLLAIATLSMLAVPLAACGGNGDDKLASRVEESAESRADNLEAMAENLEDRADKVRENGKDRAAAIDAADVNAHAMSDEQKAAITGNEAAAVR